MRNILVAGLLLGCAMPATATPLTSWNLNLGTLGGSNATNIASVTLDGYGELEQTIVGNTAVGNPFTFSASLAWVQFQPGGGGSPASFGLPGGYSELFFAFEGLTGTLDAFGNAVLTPGVGTIGLYLGDGATELTLATFELGPGSTAEDIAYYDGFSIAPFYALDFRLSSALAGLFTDDQGNPILPGADFSLLVDGLLDLNFFDNPSAVPGGDGTSLSLLVHAGYLGPVNVQDGPGDPPLAVPEPGSALLVALGLMGLIGLRKRAGP